MSQAQVIKLLEKRPMTSKELAEKLSVNTSSVTKNLLRLRKRKRVVARDSNGNIIPYNPKKCRGKKGMTYHLHE